VARKPDIIGVIEAAYRVEQSEAAWLETVLDASRPWLDRGLGVLCAIYDVSLASRPRATACAGFDLPDTFDLDLMRGAFRSLSETSLHSLLTTSGSSVVPWERRFSDLPEHGATASLPVVPSPFGPSDMLVINAADPTGHGCFISANHRRRHAPSRAERALWDRLAVHFCAGLRLRRRLASGRTRRPEAVLTPSGRVAHAEHAAQSRAAREELRDAVIARERARGSQRFRAPDAAVDGWKGLVAARWTLLDSFERDGKRYLLAQRNDPAVSWIETLTERERQVVAYASLGRWNKLIAYDLGIAHATVRVLLARAAAKAGVRTRAELVARYVRDRVAR